MSDLLHDEQQTPLEAARALLRDGEALLDCFQYDRLKVSLRLISPHLPDMPQRTLDLGVIQQRVKDFYDRHTQWRGAIGRMWQAEVRQERPRWQDVDQRDLAASRALAELDALGEVLVQPILASLQEAGIRRLIVSPDGVLHRVPWPALRVVDAEGLTRSLIELVEVASVSSLTRLRELRQRPPVAVRRLLLAAPFGDSDSGDGLTAREVAEASRTFRAASDEREPQRILGASRGEVEAIAKIATANGRDAADVVLLQPGTETADAIVKAFPWAHLVHLATHGGHHPHVEVLQQYVIRAAKNEPIAVRELLLERMRMPNLLAVVLSACELGSGVVRGADVAGFAEAFFHAGARLVVAPLFAVPDRTTALLMVEWYHQWFVNGEIAAATAWQDAVAAFRAEHPKLDHPFFWGGFLLFGDGGVTIGG